MGFIRSLAVIFSPIVSPQRTKQRAHSSDRQFPHSPAHPAHSTTTWPNNNGGQGRHPPSVCTTSSRIIVRLLFDSRPFFILNNYTNYSYYIIFTPNNASHPRAHSRQIVQPPTALKDPEASSNLSWVIINIIIILIHVYWHTTHTLPVPVDCPFLYSILAIYSYVDR